VEKRPAEAMRTHDVETSGPSPAARYTGSNPSTLNNSAFRIDAPAAPRTVLCPSNTYLMPRIGH
jgi:hypothetical protein